MENQVRQNPNSRAASLNVEDYIFETTAPTEEIVKARNNAYKTIMRRVLPDCILVRVELTDDSRVTVRYTPSVTGLIGYDQTPAPLSPDEVVNMLTPSVVVKVAFEAFTAVAHAKEKVGVTDFVVGDSVIAIDGPFAGVHAIITEINVN